ncbi:MurR/RpiR family transcriptional regulator [Magnetospira sp. QH-2]|uniref:MurR/RpiR family transcriptional regulator n=1 Tax=Magnetospira sp. (strain QH-2) TaxID=1288970 RepID=UPI0003E81C2C|nr:MurR/RpiR family transcriptional regulator [Magnetospira sp. QH-2]CCQ73633.1 Putative transcriptional regulator [Magnetospira sp. QH-2]
MNFQAVCQQIEKSYAGLSPQLKQAARYALDHPDDVALQSMRRLASMAGVHPSTMVRLVRELGMEGYTEFREPFRTRLRTAPGAYSRDARSLQQGTSVERLMQDVFDQGRSIPRELTNQLSHCADLLGQARHIYVAGVRSCFPVAFYFQYACRMFRDNVVLLDGQGGTFADDLRRIGPEDVVLAVSFQPYSRNVVRVVDFAISRKARVIALTDSPLSPLLPGDDVVPLVLRSATPSFFHSVVPAMAVIQGLVMMLIANGGDAALDGLEDSESQLDAFEAYWLDGDRRRGGLLS